MSVKLPSDDKDEIDRVLEPYLLALGKVAHSWNHMHDQLAQLFCVVSRIENYIGLPVWHALRSDRSQRDLLDAAIRAAARDDDWIRKFPSAESDVLWLLKKIQTVANKRNDAIHAPCFVSLGVDDFEIQPHAFYGNPRAKALYGKDILAEFAWYEGCADALKNYAHHLHVALLIDERGTWPARPLLPTLGQANCL